MEQECPICFELIDNINDKISTQCKHNFHSSCFLTNVAYNGFNCPCCRTKLAEIPDTDSDSETEDEDENEDENEDEDEDEDEDDLWMYSDDDDHYEVNHINNLLSQARKRDMLPDVEHVWQKLKEMKYTSLDLLKIIMYNEAVLCKNSNNLESRKLTTKMEDDTMKIINDYETNMSKMKEEQNLMLLEDTSLKNKLNIEIRQQRKNRHSIFDLFNVPMYVPT